MTEIIRKKNTFVYIKHMHGTIITIQVIHVHYIVMHIVRCSKKMCV